MLYPRMNKPKPASVKLSSKFQVVIPQQARAKLGLMAGDELLVLVKEDRIVMMPKPKNFTRHLAGLHKEIWQDSESYLNDERNSW
jgi:AbrB family looped-hinge helix DNA binding protein